MSNQSNPKHQLSLLLKKANDLGYSLIETVGAEEAKKLYELAAAYEAENDSFTH